MFMFMYTPILKFHDCCALQSAVTTVILYTTCRMFLYTTTLKCDLSWSSLNIGWHSLITFMILIYAQPINATGIVFMEYQWGQPYHILKSLTTLCFSNKNLIDNYTGYIHFLLQTNYISLVLQFRKQELQCKPWRWARIFLSG